jgi:PAS domain S-box-containing protein
LNDLEGTFVDANKAAEKLIGYSKEDMIGKNMLDLGVLPEDQIEQVIESLEKNIKDEPTGPQEFKLMKRNGSLVPVEISTFPIKIHEKNLVLGIARDITERKKSEDILRESEEKFRSLIEDSTDIVLLLDENGEISYVSPSIEKVWGYSVDEILEKDLDYYLNEFLHPDDLESVMKAYINETENPGSLETIECRFKHKDGTWGYVQARGNNLYDNPAVKGLVITLTDISEQKKAEDEIQIREKKYRSLIDNLSDTVIECDSDGNFSYASPQVTDIFGYTPEEIVGQNAFEFIHPDDLEAAMDAMAEALNKGEKYNLEYRTKHKDGHYIYVSGSGKVLQEEGGIRIVGVVRDITERKQWEEELHRSFSITRATLESTEDGIVVVDNKGEVKIFNEKFVDIWGIDSEHLITYDIKILNKFIIDKIKDPFTFVEVQNELENHLDVESFDSFEMKDGRILEVTSKPQYVGEAIVGRVWSYRDITERKHAEEAIKNSEAKFRQFFENDPEYCYMVSAEGKIIDVNKAAIEMMGYKKEELVNKHVNMIYAPQEIKKIDGLINEWLETGVIENEELNIITKSGEQRTILLSANNILDDRGKLLHSISVQRDITERKCAQEELERTLNELERSNKELEQFAYIASHDLQEPLRMVSSYVELLNRRYGDKISDEADDFINFAIEGTKRMQRLINDLLKYSRVSTRGKNLETTDTENVLNDVLSDLGMMIEDSGATVTHDKLPMVQGDDVQLGQVFQNLVSNALKYHGIEKPNVHVSAEKKGNEWLFSIKDNGIGIDEKYETRIFQIFQQLHPKGKFPGTGIGLAVVKRIIERHKGKIWFESEPGSGTTFYFTIPTTIETDELESEVKKEEE